MAGNHHLYLIRHLPTAGNEKKQYVGWTDESIVPGHGRVSLERFHGCTAVHGSDLQRARESAKIYFPDAEYMADPRFRECHFGDFEGKTYEQLQYDSDYRKWLDDPYGVPPRNGESLDMIEERLLPALIELESGSIVMTHGGPIRLALTRFAPKPAEFWSWSVPHGSIWRLEWRHEADLKEGKRCVFISEEPITENGNS